MSEQWRGTFGCVQQEDEFVYRDGVGDVTYRVWEGPKSSAIALYHSLKASNWKEVELSSRDNVVFRVRATKDGVGDATDEITDQWEILPAIQTMDILNSPAARAMTDDDLAMLKKMIADPEYAKTITIDTSTPEGKIWEICKRNPSGFEWTTYVLRNTRNTGDNTQLMVSYAGVGKVFTFDQILSLLDANEFPAIGYALTAIQNAGYITTVPDYYNWGWLKQAPTHMQSLNRKYAATMEWKLDCWPEILYPAA